MPPLRDFLSRFRPAGAPGAARAAVPADTSRELAAELDPVLRLLDGPDAECARMLAEARRDGQDMIAAARADAVAVAAEARQRAAAVRQETVRQILADARTEAADITARASRQAADERELARRRTLPLAQRAVAMIADLGAGDLEAGDLRDADSPDAPSRAAGEGPSAGGRPDPPSAPGGRS